MGISITNSTILLNCTELSSFSIIFSFRSYLNHILYLPMQGFPQTQSMLFDADPLV